MNQPPDDFMTADLAWISEWLLETATSIVESECEARGCSDWQLLQCRQEIAAPRVQRALDILEQVARELDRRLVVSDDAIGRLAGAKHYLLEDLGTRVLRGRTSPVQIYAVTSPVSARERVHAS